MIGAGMEVHRELGNGAVYQGTLQIEFKRRNSPFQREQSVPVLYKRVALGAPLVLRIAPFWSATAPCSSSSRRSRHSRRLNPPECFIPRKRPGLDGHPSATSRPRASTVSASPSPGILCGNPWKSAVPQQSARAAGGRSVFRQFVCPPGRGAIDRSCGGRRFRIHGRGVSAIFPDFGSNGKRRR